MKKDLDPTVLDYLYYGITKEECDQGTLRRYEQYLDSLADDRAFQKRYMFPVEVKVSKKKTIILEEDEGVTPCTQEGLAGLKPVDPAGVISYGAQTYPADGNCGFIVTTRDMAKGLSADAGIEIQIISYMKSGGRIVGEHTKGIYTD